MLISAATYVLASSSGVSGLVIVIVSSATGVPKPEIDLMFIS